MLRGMMIKRSATCFVITDPLSVSVENFDPAEHKMNTTSKSC
jgi:hypothetical protein